MKKEELLSLSSEKSKLIIEYIEQILSNNPGKNSKMEFWWAKLNGNDTMVLNIEVPSNNWEKHLNLEITTDHCDILYEQLFNDLLDTFLQHETIGVTRYYTIKSSGVNMNFNGIDAVNTNNDRIKIDFALKGKRFDEIINNYNNRINEFVHEYENKDEEHIKK